MENMEKHRGIITLSVMLATVMQALDGTIANVALPRMQGTFSATQDQMIWVLTSYIVAAAIMIPLTGWLSVRYGRRLVFLTSIAGFTITSVLCGICGNLPEMVLFRLMQGISGAALVPLSQAILFDINPPERHAKAMATWGAGVTLGPILGPILGGYFTDYYSWRWVFLINVPLGIVAFSGLWLYLHKTQSETHKSTEISHKNEPIRNKFDVFGFIALSLALGALQLMLDRGELLNWFSSTEIVIEALVMVTGFYVFIAHTLTSDHSYLNPALFRDLNFSFCNILVFFVGIIMLAPLALIPSMLQSLMNYPVVTSGLVIAPRGLGAFLGMFLAGKLVERIDARILMTTGLIFVTVSLWQMTHFSLLMDKYPLIRTGLMQGIGVGLLYVPMSTCAFSTLPVELRTEGTAFFALMRNIGSSIGISTMTTFFTRNAQITHANLADHITPYAVTFHPELVMNHFDSTSSTMLEQLNMLMTGQAYMLAYCNDFKALFYVTLGMFLFVLPLQIQKHSQASSTHSPILE